MYAQFCSIYENHLLKTPQLYPGVIDFLETWPGRVAIVSNKPVRFIRPLVAALDLDRFPWVDVIGGDSLAFAKPHREPVDHVLRKSGCSALSAVLVGDGIQDVGAAQAAGVHLVAVDYGYVTIPRLRQQGARHFVSDLRDLPRVFTHLQPA
jgi:phosphoglycolate phosphatase